MVLGKFVNLWRHWATAILDISPNWLMAPGLAFRQPVIVEIKNLDIFFATPLDAIETAIGGPVSKVKGRLVDIRLTHENFLKRQVKLPKMPEKHFVKAMEINLQKSSPVPIEQLTWRYGIRKAKDGYSISMQYIIKNDKLELLEKTINTLGLQLWKVSTKASNSAFLDRSVEYNQPKRTWLMVNLIAVLVFCSWVGYMKVDRLSVLQDANTNLTMQLSELQELAIERSKLVLVKKSTADLALKTAAELYVGQNRTAIFEKLSVFLTDEVWISEMLINGASVSLGGFSTLDVASLVTDIKNESWVADARLVSAISGARTSKSKRFQIQLELDVSSKTIFEQ